MYSFGFAPKVQTILDETTTFETKIKLQNKNMMQESNKDRSSKYKDISFTLNKMIDKENKLSGSFQISKDKAVRGTRIDVSKKVLSSTASYTRKLKYDIDSTLTYKHDENRYLDYTPGLMPKRRDKINIYTLGLSKKINDKVSLNTSYSYTKSKSNVEAYSYKKNSFLFNIVKTF